MSETLPVFIAGCGLAFVVVGMIAVGAVWVFRRSGIDFFDTLGAAQEIFGGDGDDDEPVSARSVERRGQPRSRKASLRERAQNLDFDAAVSRYSASDAENPRLRRRRRSDRDRLHDDEVFGGMLDEDGDGSIDF